MKGFTGDFDELLVEVLLSKGEESSEKRGQCRP